MRVTHGLVLAMAVAALGGVARGDGKFFVRENVPADVPYQRAFLLFHDGTETLVLQSKYEIPPSAVVDTLGWVVPVPAIPQISSIEADTAWWCFYLANLKTQPQAIYVSFFFLFPAIALFLVAGAISLVCLVQYPFVRRVPAARAAWAGQVRWAVPGAIVGFLLSVGSLPSLGGGSGTAEVVKTERVGIYDVKVVRAEDSNAITGWLQENGLGFGEEDGRVFQKYVDRGWCFVTARIQPPPGTDRRRIAAEGMAAPLILKFASEKPVYPLALTATAGTETEILIYTFSDAKLTCGDRLKLLDARRNPSRQILSPFEGETKTARESLGSKSPRTPQMLCKFKGRLTAAQMTEDLTFDFAPDNQPYTMHRIVW